MGSPIASVRIDRRFRGPPNSGNGGYVCGRLAEFVEGDSQVRLMRPPPLDRDLKVVTDGADRLLLDGDEPVARASPFAVEMTPPPALSPDEARARSAGYRGFENHAFGGCFVCGPEREPGDGLRIFPGGADDGIVAATWRPDPDLADAAGRVAAQFVWAALDCPGGWSWLHRSGRVAVLGEFAVHIERPVPAGAELVVMGWPIADDGRKHPCGSALYTAGGEPLAWSIATWLEIDPATLGP